MERDVDKDKILLEEIQKRKLQYYTKRAKGRCELKPRHVAKLREVVAAKYRRRWGYDTLDGIFRWSYFLAVDKLFKGNKELLSMLAKE